MSIGIFQSPEKFSPSLNRLAGASQFHSVVVWFLRPVQSTSLGTRPARYRLGVYFRFHAEYCSHNPGVITSSGVPCAITCPFAIPPVDRSTG